jgi:hypothetical protein
LFQLLEPMLAGIAFGSSALSLIIRNRWPSGDTS